jgi:hypothetical protein
MAADWGYAERGRFGNLVDLEGLERDRADYDAVGEIEFNMPKKSARRMGRYR